MRSTRLLAPALAVLGFVVAATAAPPERTFTGPVYRGPADRASFYDARRYLDYPPEYFAETPYGVVYSPTVTGYPVVSYRPNYVPPAVGEAQTPLPPNAAHILIRAPRDAAVWVQGVLLPQPGREREFISPPLEPGLTFRYEIRARWAVEGHTMEQIRHATVQANGTAWVDFREPDRE